MTFIYRKESSPLKADGMPPYFLMLLAHFEIDKAVPWTDPIRAGIEVQFCLISCLHVSNSPSSLLAHCIESLNSSLARLWFWSLSGRGSSFAVIQPRDVVYQRSFIKPCFFKLHNNIVTYLADASLTKFVQSISSFPTSFNFNTQDEALAWHFHLWKWN